MKSYAGASSMTLGGCSGLVELPGRGRVSVAEVARSVGRDWHTWTRDPNAVESARRRLGQKLDALAPAEDSHPPSGRSSR